MLPTDREQDPRDSGSGSTTIRRGQNRALPIAGYLFKEKVDVNDIIDPVDMGLKVLQARRKGGIEKFYSPERYQLQIKELMTSVTEKKKSRTQTDLQMWGDDITNSSDALPVVACTTASAPRGASACHLLAACLPHAREIPLMSGNCHRPRWLAVHLSFPFCRVTYVWLQASL